MAYTSKRILFVYRKTNAREPGSLQIGYLLHELWRLELDAQHSDELYLPSLDDFDLLPFNPEI